MDIVGKIKKTGEIISVEYNQRERYTYTIRDPRTNTRKTKDFMINSAYQAFIKAILDVGEENIDFSSTNWKWAVDKFQQDKIAYTSTIMESCIGLSKKYNLRNLVNSRGEKLKQYKAYRNYYSTGKGCDTYEIVMKLIELRYMQVYKDETESDYLYVRVTEQGIYWLECKYDIRIFEDR